MATVCRRLSRTMWSTLNIYLNNCNFVSWLIVISLIVISLQYAHTGSAFTVLSVGAIFDNYYFAR